MTAARPRVLHVFGALSVGGAEAWLAQTLPVSDDLEWDLEFCLLAEREGPLASDMRGRGYRVFHCRFRPAITFPWRFLRVLRDGRYQALHSHVLLFSGVILGLGAWAGTRLRFAHAHNDSDGRRSSLPRRAYRAAMRALLRRVATVVIGCTRRAAEYTGVEASRVRVLPYGIDLTRFDSEAHPEALRAELDIPQEVRIVGHCGRLEAQKNQRFLIDVFAQSLKRDPTLFLVIAGEGSLRQSLLERARRLGVEERVRLLGLRSDVPRLLCGLFDVFVLPSLHEGLPVALLEAQAAGLPCLISDRVNAETIVDRRRVRVAPLTANVEVWADALVESRRIARMAPEEARERVRAKGFDAADSRRRLVEIYDEARRGSGRAAPSDNAVGEAA